MRGAGRKFFHVKPSVHPSEQFPLNGGFAFHRKLQFFIRRAKIHRAKRFSASQNDISSLEKESITNISTRYKLPGSPRLIGSLFPSAVIPQVSLCSTNPQLSLQLRNHNITPTVSKHCSSVKTFLSICSFIHDKSGYNSRYFSYSPFLKYRRYRQLQYSGNITPATALTSKDTHAPFLLSILNITAYWQVLLII